MLYQISCRVPFVHLEYFSEWLETVGDAVSMFEIEEGKLWEISGVCQTEPNMLELTKTVNLLAHQCAMKEAPEIQINPIESKDWVSEVQKQFTPIDAGRFYIHAAHDRAPQTRKRLSLCIDPGRAFGTGRHPTTRGCLLMLDQQFKKRTFKNILDVGTGSGILAMAAAMCAPHANIIASDIDPIAIDVAKENAKENHLAARIKFVTAIGYQHRAIKNHAPYDLILANILAKPLITLAPTLNQHLAPGGVAILSGLLITQIKEVFAAHRNQGLTLHAIYKEQDWAALVLGK